LLQLSHLPLVLIRPRQQSVYQMLITNCSNFSSGGLVAYADSRSDDALEKPQLPPRKKVVVLGTGWGGTTFLRNLDSSLYDVQVISPRNYFAFTPLLPSVTSGTVEPRSIVEPIRRILAKVCMMIF
jgi:NADH:ubiquinone reductase (non-electrogenic)